MDPDADWMLNDDDTVATTDDVSLAEVPAQSTTTKSSAVIPSGSPIPNPYAHVLKEPAVERQYQHWIRHQHLQYQYLNEYARVYYDDCIDYINKRIIGINRDPPHPQEWGERVLRVYDKEGERLSGDDWQYWYTIANEIKPRHQVVHAVHSKESILRQYKSVLC